jgi:1,4-dihydroxy-2-naphthoate octaprenyltransferase
MRRVVWWIIVCVVLISTISGLWNGFRDWPENQNLGERMVTVSVIIYGIAGAFLLAAMVLKRKWIIVPLIVWAIGIFFAATVSPFVYSDEAKWIGTIASGICTGALLMLIALRVRKEATSW